MHADFCEAVFGVVTITLLQHFGMVTITLLQHFGIVTITLRKERFFFCLGHPCHFKTCFSEPILWCQLAFEYCFDCFLYWYDKRLGSSGLTCLCFSIKFQVMHSFMAGETWRLKWVHCWILQLFCCGMQIREQRAEFQ